MLPQKKYPLEGLRVLDLGRYQAGPRCALMFARMGAEVIKIEALTGDESRKNAPVVRGQSAYWVQYNSGKKSLSINLRTDEGKHVLKELVIHSDIFLQNFRPGTIDKMGFGYEVLKALNKKIIMINVSAYGQTGSYKDRVGFDPLGQALGGMMSLNGFADGPPIRNFFPLIDRITALHGCIGALAALHEREFSGEGQAIDVSLGDTGFTVNEIPISAFLGDGIIQDKTGNGMGMDNAYQTSDGWVLMAATNRKMWERCCEALGWDDWVNDPNFEGRNDRRKNYKKIEGRLIPWFKSKTTEEAVEYLNKFSVPIAPINDVVGASINPLIEEREMMVEVPDKIAGKIQVTGKSIKFSRTPMTIGSAPTIGQHTKEILSDVLGYEDDYINQLVSDEIIRCD